MHFLSSSSAILATICMAPFTAALPTASTLTSHLHTRDNICYVAPSNTTATAATNSAAQIVDVPQLDTNIATGCLTFCKDVTGCVSAEYGVVEAGGDEECLMFTVAASALAAPTDGQSLVAFDVGCEEVY